MLRGDGGFAEIGAKPTSAGQRCAEVSTWRDLGDSVSWRANRRRCELVPCRSRDASLCGREGAAGTSFDGLPMPYLTLFSGKGKTKQSGAHSSGGCARIRTLDPLIESNPLHDVPG